MEPAEIASRIGRRFWAEGTEQPGCSRTRPSLGAPNVAGYRERPPDESRIVWWFVRSQDTVFLAEMAKKRYILLLQWHFIAVLSCVWNCNNKDRSPRWTSKSISWN